MSFYIKLFVFSLFTFLHGGCLYVSVLIVRKIRVFGEIWAEPFRFFVAAFCLHFISCMLALVSLIAGKNFGGWYGLWLLTATFIATALFLRGLIKHKNMLVILRSQRTPDELAALRLETARLFKLPL